MAALSDVESVPFWNCTASSRTRWSIECTSFSEPSAVCTRLTASCELRWACARPRILTTKLLADGESSRVVGRTVDAVAGAQALHGLARTIARGGKLAVGVEGLDVAVDTKGHGVFSLMTVGVIRVVPGQLPVAPRTPSSDAPARPLGSFWKKGTAGPRRTPRPHTRITSGEKTRRRRVARRPPFPISTGPFPQRARSGASPD